VRSLRLWHRECPADLLRKKVGDLGVSRNGLDASGERVLAERLRASLALEDAAVASQVLEKGLTPHPILTTSRAAPSGTPRKPSSRRSWRILSMADARLCKLNRPGIAGSSTA
jgi:hypothetical protein